MIRVRDDDILVGSSSWSSPFGRFKQVHEWCLKSDKVIHVPTILVEEIQEYPECIEYVKEQTALGNMEPELHGLQHIDYAALDIETVVSHLNTSKDWMYENLNVVPKKWYTPWGAGDDPRGAHLDGAAASVGLIREGVKKSRMRKLKGSEGAIAKAMVNDFDALERKEIMMHWWEGGARLLRVIETLNHGSWEAAKAANKRLFS